MLLHILHIVAAFVAKYSCEKRELLANELGGWGENSWSTTLLYGGNIVLVLVVICIHWLGPIVVCVLSSCFLFVLCIKKCKMRCGRRRCCQTQTPQSIQRQQMQCKIFPTFLSEKFNYSKANHSSAMKQTHINYVCRYMNTPHTYTNFKTRVSPKSSSPIWIIM